MKKKILRTVLPTLIVILAFGFFMNSGSHKEKSIFSKQCEIVSSGKAEPDFIRTLFNFNRPRCKFEFLRSGWVNSSSYITGFCGEFRKTKLLNLTDYTSNGSYTNIELINDDQCRILNFFEPHTFDDSMCWAFSAKHVVKAFFEKIPPGSTIGFIKQYGFRVIGKTKDVWSVHVFPAVTYDILVKSAECGEKAVCEDSVVIDKALEFREEYVIEDDNGVVLSIEPRHVNRFYE